MDMTRRVTVLLSTLVLATLPSCGNDGISAPDDEGDVYRLPIVVHVLHMGEPIGTGHNLSVERIQGQIRILNEDFRRKAGTRGFNTHPDGGDSRIEFVLAQLAPA